MSVLSVLRLLAALSLMVLPGAWLAFAVRGAWLEPAARFAIAGALSPAVVAIEFFALRLAGVSVPAAAWSLVVINAPAVWLVRQHSYGRVSPTSIVQSSFVLGLLVVGASVPWYFIEQLRIYHAHTWTHSSVVHQFLSGAVLPEEPELAGIRLAYPWLSYVYWATLGTVANWAPTRVYALTNVVWLTWVALGIYAAGRALDARGFASRAMVLWVTLGTNCVGAAIAWITNWLPGDIRYTPWLRKYITFNEMPFALALFASLVPLAILAVRRKGGRDAVMLFAAVLTASGIVYPMIFPSAFSLAAFVPFVLWLELLRGRDGTRRDVFLYAGALTLGTLCAVLSLWIATAARVTSGFELSSADEVASKLASTVIVLAPFLCAAAVVVGQDLARQWRRVGLKQLLDRIDSAHLLLLLATVPPLLFAAVSHLLRSGYGEYKLMFGAPLTLAPFIGVALTRLTPARVPATLVVVLSGLLLSPTILMQNAKYSLSIVASAPPATEDGVTVHVATGSPEAGWTNAIRERTPPDTVVVANRSTVFVPSPTSRSLFAPIVDVYFPGYSLESREQMVELRGYSSRLVEERLAVVSRLLEARADRDAEDALAEVARLGRPIAILAWRGKHDRLLAWLDARHMGRRIFEDDSGRVVWLYPR